MIITEMQLRQICPKLPTARVPNLVRYINTICPQYGIVNADIFHEFMANVCEESGCFTRYEENLHYTSAARLVAVWPSRFPTTLHAQPYVNNPKGLAMKVYGKRKDLGNITDEDGWNFRGAGPIQLTGRSNFTAFAAWMKEKHQLVKSPQEWAHQLRSSDEYGIHSACWIFAIAKNLIQLAIDDNMKVIVRKINGGYTNLASRQKFLQQIEQIIPLI